MSEKVDAFNSELEDAIAAVQPKPQKTTPPASSRRVKKRYITTAAILIAVLAYLLWPREERLVIDNPVPYIFDRRFENSLTVFQKLEKHNEVLLVHGPRNIGKSRGLVTFGKQLIDDDRLFVHMDCTKLRSGATDAEILSFLRNSFMTGFRRLDGHDLRSGDSKSALAAISALVTVLGMNETKTTRHAIHNPFLREAADLISVILTKIQANPHLSLSILFDVLDRLGPSLRPVVVLSSPELLGDGLGAVINAELVDVFRKLSSDTRNTGFIIEISDETVLPDVEKLFPGVNVRLVQVGEFDQEAARQKLNVNGMFKPHEQARLFEVFGGHGRYFCLVHEAMRRSKSFDDALESVILSNEFALNTTLFGPTHSAEAVDEKLELIHSVRAKPQTEVDLANESVKFLVRHGILTLSGDRASLVDPAVLRWAARLPERDGI